MTVNEFTQAAMALSSDERAALATELLSSLEPTDGPSSTDVETAWATESTMRARQVLDGQVEGEDASSVIDRVRRGLSAER